MDENNWLEEDLSVFAENSNVADKESFNEQIKIKRLKKNVSDVWTDHDIQYLKDNYAIKPRKDIAKELSKNERSVEWQVKKSGLQKASRDRWSEEDELFLTCNVNLTYEEMADKLNRTVQSVKKKCQKMNFCLTTKNFRWMEADIEFLRDNYAEMTSEEIATRMGISKSSVEMKIFKLGLKKSNSKTWKSDEIDYLRSNKNLTYTELAETMGVSKGSVRFQFNKLNIKKDDKRNRWSDDEVNFLRQFGCDLTLGEISQKLHRKKELVQQKAKALSIKTKPAYFNWQQEHDDFLRMNYLNHENVWLAKNIGVTKSSITHRLHVLELTRPEFVWTDDKDDFLSNNFEHHRYQWLADQLGCSKNQVKSRLRILELKKNIWTEDQDRMLLENVAIKSNRELSDIIGKNVSEIQSRICSKGLQRMVKEPKWTGKELQYVRDNFYIMTYGEMGQVLNRSIAAINHKIFQMELVKLRSWTESEVDYVELNYNIMNTHDIAQNIDRSYDAIKHMARYLGVIKDRPYTIPEKTVGQILIALLGNDKVKAQYNDCVERPRKMFYPHPFKLRVTDEIEYTSTHICPDYELLHPDGVWIPSEYFGFSGVEYDLRKNIKKLYLKRMFGRKFLSFGAEDLRRPDLIRHKLVRAGFIPPR